MNKHFEKPALTIIALLDNDIIMTSNGNNLDAGDDIEEGENVPGDAPRRSIFG